MLRRAKYARKYIFNLFYLKYIIFICYRIKNAEIPNCCSKKFCFTTMRYRVIAPNLIPNMTIRMTYDK